MEKEFYQGVGFGLIVGFTIGLMVSTPNYVVIERYQLCLESGANVEYCENNI